MCGGSWCLVANKREMCFVCVCKNKREKVYQSGREKVQRNKRKNIKRRENAEAECFFCCCCWKGGATGLARRRRIRQMDGQGVSSYAHLFLILNPRASTLQNQDQEKKNQESLWNLPPGNPSPNIEKLAQHLYFSPFPVQVFLSD